MRVFLKEKRGNVMAYDVFLTRVAARDRDAIASYLADVLDSPQAARRFLDAVDDAIETLSATPELYAVSQEPRLAALGYRRFPVTSYLMLYRFDEQRVIIAHIFHGSQDYARLV